MEMLCAENFANGLRIKKNKVHAFRKVESFVAAQNAKPFLLAVRSARSIYFRLRIDRSRLVFFFNETQNKSET